MARLVLASTSPRRREILDLADIPYTTIAVDTNEELLDMHDPHNLCIHLACQKAKVAAALCNSQDIILAADTVVYAESSILGKPKDAQDARRMLLMLSGKEHEVITGICVIGENTQQQFSVSTKVHFSQIPHKDIEQYILSKEPYDKAGAYGIQGWAAKYIYRVDGCYYNVMGLPLSAVYRVIKKLI